MSRRIAPYPWSALDRLSRRSVRAAQRVREHLAALDFRGSSQAAGELLGTEVEVIGQDEHVGVPERLGLDLSLEVAGLPVLVSCDPELASEVASRLLDRPPPVAAPGQALSEELTGALAAVLVEAGRRSGSTAALRLLPSFPAAAEGLTLRGTVLVGGRAFGVAAWVAFASLEERDSRSPPSGVDLADLGALPVALPVIAALMQLERAELGALRVGDAVLPGEGWLWLGPDRGPAVLAAPSSDQGVPIEFSDAGGGAIVLRGGTFHASIEADEPMSDETLHRAVLEAPVVVRVEVGSLSLSAQEWARLRAGDVIETGQRIADPVVLRVGGRAVARGELVEVDGELGVRILEMDTGGHE